MVDSEEEGEVEAWVEVKVRLFAINVHIQAIWKGIFRTLVLLATTVIHLTMSLKTDQYCYLNFRRDEE
jgi:hypothetical protein